MKILFVGSREGYARFRNAIPEGACEVEYLAPDGCLAGASNRAADVDGVLLEDRRAITGKNLEALLMNDRVDLGGSAPVSRAPGHACGAVVNDKGTLELSCALHKLLKFEAGEVEVVGGEGREGFCFEYCAPAKP